MVTAYRDINSSNEENGFWMTIVMKEATKSWRLCGVINKLLDLRVAK